MPKFYCEHGDLIEENKRLKAAVEKGLATCIQGKKNLDDLLSNQRDNVSKEGIGFASKKKNKKEKNNNKNSVTSSLPNMTTFVKAGEKSQVSSAPAQARVSGVSRPESPGTRPESLARKTGVSAPTHNDFAGSARARFGSEVEQAKPHP